MRFEFNYKWFVEDLNGNVKSIEMKNNLACSSLTTRLILI